ncbi:flagellar motor protein, partial [Pseudomonas aeruginosa]
MDVLSLVGIILAFVAIVGGNFLEGGHAGALLNGPAALLQTPVNVLKRGLGMLGWVFFPPREDLSGGIDRIVSWSMT